MKKRVCFSIVSAVLMLSAFAQANPLQDRPRLRPGQPDRTPRAPIPRPDRRPLPRQPIERETVPGDAYDPDNRQSVIPEDDGNFHLGRRLPEGNESSDFSAEIQMGTPQFQGDGCQPGEVSFALTPDKKNLSILFDNFIAEAGGESGMRLVRRLCNLHLPFKVPAGYRMAITKIDYRGYNLIPARGRARFVTTYHFTDVGRRAYGTRIRRGVGFTGPLDEDYNVSATIPVGRTWSQCGQDYNLNIDIKVIAQTNPSEDPVISTVDSVDAVQGEQVRYALLWQKCDDRSNGRRPRAPIVRERSRR